MRRSILGLVAALTCFAVPALAGQLTSRADLMTLLGTSAVTDDFEGYSIADGGVVNTQLSYMDNTTVVNGNGPGLIHPGATYSSIRGPFTWIGAGYKGIPSRSIVVWNVGPVAPAKALGAQDIKLFFAVLVQFANPVVAFGADLLRFDVVGIVTVEIYDVFQNQIDELFIDIPDIGVPSFAGYSYPDGIGAVVIKNTKIGTTYSPTIDNLTYGFGAPVPTKHATWGRIKALYR